MALTADSFSLFGQWHAESTVTGKLSLDLEDNAQPMSQNIHHGDQVDALRSTRVLCFHVGGSIGRTNQNPFRSARQGDVEKNLLLLDSAHTLPTKSNCTNLCEEPRCNRIARRHKTGRKARLFRRSTAAAE